MCKADERVYLVMRYLKVRQGIKEQVVLNGIQYRWYSNLVQSAHRMYSTPNLQQIPRLFEQVPINVSSGCVRVLPIKDNKAGNDFDQLSCCNSG